MSFELLKTDALPEEIAGTYRGPIADEVIARISEGQLLAEICEEPHLPPTRIVRLWVEKNVLGFGKRFELARKMQAHHMFEKAIIKSRGGKDEAGILLKAAAKADPDTYGEKAEKGVQPVAIQIHTSLDLNEGKGVNSTEPYTVEVITEGGKKDA